MAYQAPLNRRTRRALLAGASFSAMAVGAAAPAWAGGPRPLSQAWFAARVDASTGQGASSSAASTLGRVTVATQNLALVASRIAALEAAESAASQAATSAAALAASTVPNGLVFGGLQTAVGASVGSTLWQGAALPTQSAGGGGRDEVNVMQTGSQALLTWQSFNVGAKTDLSFNQSAGGSSARNWVVLNRVDDPSASPSQILGTISAPGKVYIINANGIVFGAGAQVNLGALIASTADITNSQFETGIYGAQSGASFAPTFTGAAADSSVVVDEGAQITTTAPAAVTSAGGYVMLFGGGVDNQGVIETPSGQTVLGAGEDFILRAGYSTTGNQTATVEGSQVASTGNVGAVTNGGVIISSLGDVTLVGHDLTQAGAVVATSSVNTRGTVHFLTATDDRDASVTLAPGAVTVVNPDNSSTTALDSQRSSLISQSVTDNALRLAPANATNPQLGDVGTLPDFLDESRIEITTGGIVSFDTASLTMSQGGQIAVQSGARAWIGDGAMLDVSGSTGAVLAMSSNLLSVNIQGNELRDAPVNRDSGLISSTNVNIDSADLVQVGTSSADASVRDYTAGGLLEVSGYLSNVGHTIDEWAAVGGTITLDANTVITQPNATFNVAGGSVSVAGGELAQSYLIGPGGQLFNVNTAPADIAYSGVYEGLDVVYARFGSSDVYTSSLATPAEMFEAGYTYGRDAGGLAVIAPVAVLEGQIDASVTNGARQTQARAAGVTDGYARGQNTIAAPGTLDLVGYNTGGTLFATNVTITDDYTPIADQISATGTLPAGSFTAIALDGTQLSAEQLGGVAITTAGTIGVIGSLGLAPGGTLALAGDSIAIGGNVSARGGSIALSNLAIDPFAASNAQTVLTPIANQAGGISIANSATIDLRGEWTNAAADATNVAGEGLENGGALSIDAVRGLVIGQGTTIDSSSGGALLAGGKTAGGAGGNVTLIGDDPVYAAYGAVPPVVAIGATFKDYGVNGGGTLAITAPSVLVAEDGSGIAGDTVLLDPATFQSGFADYVVNGFNGLSVAAGTAVSVAEPVYVFYGSAAPGDFPTGSDPASVFSLILPPTYTQDQANARLTQRKGASVAFIANDRPGQVDAGGGAIDLGAGSAISVDPGQSVRIEAFGQLTDDAAITARGGNVALINESQNYTGAGTTPVINANATLTLSVYVGSDASIDVAGLATTALDGFGRPYGEVTPGGTITIGGAGTEQSADYVNASDAAVIIRPGAVLDASGAAATIDLLAGTTPALASQSSNATISSDPIAEASNGGTIALSSYSGIFIDGTVRAAAGGAGASGGLLAIALESSDYAVGPILPDALYQPRVLSVSETTQQALAVAGFAAGDKLPVSLFGTASISQQQIEAGGFGTADLFARDAIAFDGDVSLNLPVALTLSEGIIADTATSGVVTITAPYVSFIGETPLTNITPTINNATWMPFANAVTGSLSVAADLIDVTDAVRFGIEASYTTPASGTRHSLRLPGFAQITLDSAGDIRFNTSSFTTEGDLTLQADQVYPTTGAVADVYAGYNAYTKLKNFWNTDGTLTVLGNGVDPAVPYSVDGSLNLYAGNIVQDGVVRAPEGNITLGAVDAGPSGLGASVDLFNSYSYAVTLMPGSITSVSLEGATVPYGGTVDGVTYAYDGSPVASFDPSVTIAGQTQTVDGGALVDLLGGGTLAGSGFVTGRGGSVNVLLSPFLVFNAAADSVSAATLTTEPVYALVPGYGSGYAPTSPVETSGSYGSVPNLGAQITIGAGVPGIAAGTYTLLPSYYALLPGAARVQLDLGAYDSTPGVTALGAGSYELNATTSVANTAVAQALPVAVIVTTNAGVQDDAEFNTESYSAFELAQAAQFGTPRSSLPEDGKTLDLIFPAIAAAGTALQFGGTAEFGAASGGYAGQADIGGIAGSTLGIDVTANGVAPNKGFTGIEASALDAIGAPRLVIGGTLSKDPTLPTQLDFVGTANQVEIEGGADLSAAEIFLTAAKSGSRGSSEAGGITVDDGAVLSTLGKGAPAYDSTNGYYYNVDGATVIALSNGLLNFTPSISQSPGFGPITIADGATLLTDGTLNFVTTRNLSLGVNAEYGAKYLSLELNTINIVSDADLAAYDAGTLVLPSGLILTQDVLTRLLDGDTATGAPALQSLTLAATSEVNFVGSVALDTTALQDLVLDTPAIYGFGTSSDQASISTQTLYWNGVETGMQGTASAASALPGGVVAGGPGFGTGSFTIAAQNIVLGYGPDTTADDQTTLDRLIEGFSSVALDASTSLSANARGSLAVYQTPGAYGAAGTGGDLTVSAPLITGAAGSVDSISAGGMLSLTPVAGGAASTATAGALGATLDLTGASIDDSTAILLNSGRLTLTATSGDVTLAGARVDLAGTATTLVNATEYSSGGSLAVTAAGNVSADGASSIDVSAVGNVAGSITVDAATGMVGLDNAFVGTAGKGLASAAFTLDAGGIGDFDALNAALDAGGVFDARAFELGSGNLTIDGSVTAKTIDIATDAGDITVAGTGVLQATGAAPGSITLAASGNLSVLSGALLDAHGTVLQTDSTGAAIEAENRALVSLTSQGGTLTLGDATIDVSSPDPTPLGQVILDAPRLLDGGAETGDVAIAAAGPIDIIGAQNIILYGSRTYTPSDANGTVAQSDTGVVGEITLDQLNGDNSQFIADTVGNAALSGATAGLAGYAGYQVRPADVIASSAASGGNLTVAGDLDLSAMRYGAGAGSAPGAGIAGLLSLRAADNLVVNGSITDGFATPEDASVSTADDGGWRLYANEPLSAAVTLPSEMAKPVLLAGGTTFGTTSGGSLDFGITIGGATLNASVVYPTGVTTAKAYTIGTGGLVATASIVVPGGASYAAGQILPAGTVLPIGTTLAQGSVLPFAVKIAPGTTWPAGASLAVFASQTVTLKLPRNTYLALDGGQTIPGNSSLVFSEGQSSVILRAKNASGEQGLIYATASLLPPGSQSWSINLVSGANLASGNVLAVQGAAALAGAGTVNTADPAGSIVLADTHYTLASRANPSISFSVIRTGTGSLNLVAGGNVDEQSLFGIYTAGTQTSLGAAEDAAFDPGRQTTTGGTVLGGPYTGYNDVVAAQQASYPDHGGDVLVSAGNDVIGDIVGVSNSGGPTAGSDFIGNWLWRQGGAGLGQSTSWWINFGSYVLPLSVGGGESGTTPVLAGFTGIGALGGGNVTVAAGNDAGEVDNINSQGVRISQGLVIAVASTGRVTSVSESGGVVTGGTTDVTGGGLLTLDVAGTLNPALQTASETTGGGTLSDLRGDIDVAAGQVGRIDLVYNQLDATDPRAQNPFTTGVAASTNGLTVAPGDGTVTIDTDRDLVLAGVGDPTREDAEALTAINPDDVPKGGRGFAGYTGFSLWTDTTAIDLFSAGGNLTPITAEADRVVGAIFNDASTDLSFTYPATLEAVAASGSLYYGSYNSATDNEVALELAPAPAGELQLIAAQSIYANGYAVDMSGAAVGVSALPNPYNPLYTDNSSNVTATGVIGDIANVEANGGSPANELFGFEDDTTTTDVHAGDSVPALIYAASGDLVNVDFGQILNFPLVDGLPFSTWYIAAKPADLYAGRDIVSNGTTPSDFGSGYAAGTFTVTPNQQLGSVFVSSGSLLMNLTSTDVSSVTAGRDILGSYFYILGPGELAVNAGRNLIQTGASVGSASLDFGVLKSLGTVVDANAANRSNGAGIALTVGAGSAGPDYTAFADLYFNSANQADLALPITAATNLGKVQETYAAQLYAWLQQNYGYTGTQSGALTYFLALPSASQAIFVREVYYDELNASGAQYSDSSSLFYHSYSRGRQAIGTLFPASASYSGSITEDSGTVEAVTVANNDVPVTIDAGIATLQGGSIQILTPGGADTFGTAGGPAPGANSGVITEGNGDIDIYSLGSVLLGQSRIFTTFGGNILIWSAAGDINAGRGAKTTTLLPPPVIAYDAYGDITLSPATPSSGAGIATLAPIAGTAPGDVSLIAPEGTVDAGEAGIRVSGNLNIAAQTVENAANVQVGGKTTGNTATVTTNAAAAAAAATSAGAAATAAANAATPASQAALAQIPSIITVEILDAGTDAVNDLTKRKGAV